MGKQTVMSLQVGNMKMYCLSFCFYCKDKSGIVGKPGLVLLRHDYNVISLQFRKSLLCYYDVMGYFRQFICINRAQFVQSSTCVLILEE